MGQNCFYSIWNSNLIEHLILFVKSVSPNLFPIIFNHAQGAHFTNGSTGALKNVQAYMVTKWYTSPEHQND